jgi:segregation and condensation protein B
MEVTLDKEKALVETVLFLESEPLEEAALARITGLGRDIVEAALEGLVEDCAASARGLEPVRSGGGWMLAPKAELWESLKERYGKKNESRLSRAALETLSIIAYSQPKTRAEIEDIRGVSADGMIRFLLDKGLIKEVGKKEAPGRPVQYGTTKDFLKYFKLGSIADLPRLDELESGRFGEAGTAEGGLPSGDRGESLPIGVEERVKTAAFDYDDETEGEGAAPTSPPPAPSADVAPSEGKGEEGGAADA